MAARAKETARKRRRSPSPVPVTCTDLELSYDCTVLVAGAVAATSTQPIADLQSLRASCKAMHMATNERFVKRRVPLERLDTMRWLENERYLAAVKNLAAAGNPDACYVVGVTCVFARQDMEQGLLCLRQAAAAGHKVAMYVLGLLLYASGAAARGAGKEYVRQVEGDASASAGATPTTNKECRRCRHISVDTVNEVTWKVTGQRRGQVAPPLPEDNHRCTASSVCGKEGWDGYGVFCSEGCRIRHEYSVFFAKVNYLH
ncbi:hypothetical protein GUJ93_ZPchr0008g13670 [Zizania palustris]|uniref:At2g35280-like TPR domain-containing protein n=1 Tax=Zizania palustris TaxID=103762 RepID=A0A8J5RHV1_ZIZPA|nr:hypothetical protein GUJ93_ZPchr0008g13670 [Zizania palustris]